MHQSARQILCIFLYATRRDSLEILWPRCFFSFSILLKPEIPPTARGLHKTCTIDDLTDDNHIWNWPITCLASSIKFLLVSWAIVNSNFSGNLPCWNDEVSEAWRCHDWWKDLTTCHENLKLAATLALSPSPFEEKNKYIFCYEIYNNNLILCWLSVLTFPNQMCGNIYLGICVKKNIW